MPGDRTAWLRMITTSRCKRIEQRQSAASTGRQTAPAALDDGARDASCARGSGRSEASEMRFIGGCVRDAILKRPVRDIDLALPLPPDRVMTLLRQAGIKVIPTGVDHGTVTAVVASMHFEITTLRMDVENLRPARQGSLHRRLERRRGAARLHLQRPCPARPMATFTTTSADWKISVMDVCASSATHAIGSARTFSGCCGSSVSMPITAGRRPTKMRSAPVGNGPKRCRRSRASAFASSSSEP